ncbi:growth factor receptor-binding protein 2 [Paragonimus westermani]|uniref:Growth factor receptor-binding protein 2 n=1 Tax=Paragonimus westermani TaxID=34504 RepID=A0A5J4NVL9_9TREM|nr:growth factor receptor-binding protein 2 [Paragonimus westermani]
MLTYSSFDFSPLFAMEAVAIYTFKPTEPDELGFEKGSILHVIEMEEDPCWYKARQGLREGMVPANYITLYSHPWYVPKCSRREAEARLLEVDLQTNLDVQPDGAFILRQSENEFGQFSISVKEGSSVLHFRVFSDPNGKYHIWNNKFQSVNELIDYHRHQTIYGDKTLLLRDCMPSKVFGPVGGGPNAILPDDAHANSGRRAPREIASATASDSSLSHRKPSSNTGSFPPGITSTYLTGRYCVAKFDFCAEFEGEMSFRRGDRILVLGEEDDNWWYAELTDSHAEQSIPPRGLIPANYVELLPSKVTGPSNTSSSRAPTSLYPA